MAVSNPNVTRVLGTAAWEGFAPHIILRIVVDSLPRNSRNLDKPLEDGDSQMIKLDLYTLSGALNKLISIVDKLGIVAVWITALGSNNFSLSLSLTCSYVSWYNLQFD